MKVDKVLIVLFFLCFPLQSWHTAAAEGKESVKNEVEEVVITAYGDPPRFEVNEEYASHPLGDGIARQWHVIESLFLQRSDVTVGFGYNSIEIQKPQIYNSLCKINSYYKKEVAADRIPVETAQAEFSRILTIAYDLYYSNDSISVENKLKDLKKTQQKIDFLSAIIVQHI